MENLEMPPGAKASWFEIIIRIVLVAAVVSVFVLLVKWAQT